eukprot:1048853-Amphidinium_carterae.2
MAWNTTISQTMSLHKWHRDNVLVVNNQHVTMRVNNAGNGTELQWNSPVTITHSSITRPSRRTLRSSTMSTWTTLTMTFS